MYYTFLEANNKDAGQTAGMHRLICIFFGRIWHKTCFLMAWLICKQERLRPACTLVQSCHSLCCLLRYYRELAVALDKEAEIWLNWIAVHTHLKELKLQDAKVPFLMSRLKLFLTYQNQLTVTEWSWFSS